MFIVIFNISLGLFESLFIKQKINLIFNVKLMKFDLVLGFKCNLIIINLFKLWFKKDQVINI